MEIQEGTPRQYLSELARGLLKRAASDRGSERLFRYSQIRREPAKSEPPRRLQRPGALTNRAIIKGNALWLPPF